MRRSDATNRAVGWRRLVSVLLGGALGLGTVGVVRWVLPKINRASVKNDAPRQKAAPPRRAEQQKAVRKGTPFRPAVRYLPAEGLLRSSQPNTDSPPLPK
jgi:hypothetical protein